MCCSFPYISLTLKASSSQLFPTCYMYTVMMFTILPVSQPSSFQFDINALNNNKFLRSVYTLLNR